MSHGLFFDSHTLNILAQLAARMVEETVALGRQFGYRYPHEYDVGFRLRELPNLRALICLRVNDVPHAFEVDHRDGDDFIMGIQRGASHLVHLWGERHDFAPSKEAASKVIEAMKKNGFEDRVVEAAREQMKNATYSPRTA